jgi:hypothetical protein
MTETRPGNVGNLKAAAARRHHDAVTRAERGLHDVVTSGQQITFRTVARTAGVSLEFLYHHPQLRTRIEHLRTQQQTTAAAARRARPNAASDAPDQPSSVIRTLSAELTQLKTRHRAEVTQLRQALQAAHGENLILRRHLGHPPPPPSDADDTAPGAVQTAAAATATPTPPSRSPATPVDL